MSAKPSDRDKPARPRAAKRAEGMAHMTAEALTALFGRSAQPFLARLPGGRVLAYNQALCDLLGYSAEEMGQLDWRKDWTAPESRAHETAMLEKLLRTGKPVRYEKEYLRKDGSRLPAELLVDLVPGEDGSPPYYWTIVHDLSERKRAEEEIQSLAKFPGENPNPVLRLSRNGRVLYANDAGRTFLSGRGAARSDLRALAEEALATERSATVDIEHGGRAWSFFVAPIVDSAYVNFYGRDITQRKRADEALERSESMLRAVLEQIPSGVTIRDARTGDLILGNARSREIMGRLVGVPGEFAQYRGLHPDGRPYQTEEWPVSRSMATGEVVDAEEIPCQRNDGTGIILSMSSAPVRDSKGQIVIGVGVFSDITERKRAEEALRASEEKYRAIVETAGEGIWVVDADRRLTYVNERMAEMLGYSVEEMTAMTWADIVATDADRTASDRRVQERKEGLRRLPESYEIALKRRDGSTLWTIVNATPRFDERGEYVGLVSMLADVTERRRAEAALRESEERYRALSESAPDAILVHRNGEVLYANPVAVALYGASRVEDLAQHNILDLVPPREAQVSFERTKKVQSGERLPVREGRILRLDGREVPIEVVSSPIEYKGGTAAQAVIRDISERKLAEEALRESEDRYRRIVETAQEGIIIADTEGVINFVNTKMADMLGYSVQELIGKPGISLVDPADLSTASASAARIKKRRSGKTEHYEIKLLRRDGGELWAYASGAPIHDGGGKHLGNLAMYADITERKRADEALQTTLERLRALVSSMHGSVLLVGENRVQLANQAFCDYFGLKDSPGNLIGISPPEMINRIKNAYLHPDKEVRRIQQIVDRRKPVIGEEIAMQDGRACVRDFIPIAVNGKSYGRLWYHMDITDRKRAEEALRESQQRLSTIVDSIADGFYALDREWRFTHMNDAAERYFGIKRKAAMGRAIFDVFPSFGGSIFETEFRRAMESGEPVHFEAPSVVTDRIVEMHAYPGPENITMLFRDVTERKLAQEDLRLRSTALQAAANGIVITDRDGAIQWVNPAFTRLTGYSATDAIGQNPRVLKSGWHDQAFYKKLWNTILSGHVWQGEIINKRKDGTLYTEEMTITPVLDDDRAVSHFIAIKQDISRRKLAEEQLERTRTEFLGEVSHELKTPITAIKGCASMALSAGAPGDPAETRELFEIIDAQTNRLTDLVANLLDVTRIEAGRLSMEPGPADLRKIVAEAKVVFEHSQYPHSLEVMLPPKMPALRADGRRIVQVLNNLFTNAAKFSSPTAPIILSAECGAEECTIRVRDSGLGIPEDKRSLLFQKFVQVHERGAKGTGLGLFICKGIVEAHGGRIWAESAGRGKGAVFSFTLPVLKGKRPPKSADGEFEGGGEAGSEPGGGRIRVVAVDDEPDILHYIEHCLRSAGYEVASTSDPLAATELVRFHSPDIVLLDMRMPGMSGLDVLEDIRRFSKVPVTFITATRNREDVIRGREFGGTTWLEKPFSPQQLLDHVGLVLARQRKR